MSTVIEIFLIKKKKKQREGKVLPGHKEWLQSDSGWGWRHLKVFLTHVSLICHLHFTRGYWPEHLPVASPCGLSFLTA